MDGCIEQCQVCEQHNDTVVDGICEICEPIYMHYVQVLSKQLKPDTSLRYLFQEALKATRMHHEKNILSMDRVSNSHHSFN